MSETDQNEFIPDPYSEARPLRFDDDTPRRRIRSRYGENGLSIAGFICGLVGIIVSCNPILGGLLGLLGIVFGVIGLARVHRSGFAIASLALGIASCLLAFCYKPLTLLLAG